MQRNGLRTYERREEGDGGRQRHGEEGRQDGLGRGEGQGDPRVAGDGQQQLVSGRDGGRVHHQQDALQPALALLDKVADGERRLLPHLALHEAEREAVAVRAHREEAVLRHGPVQPVVERHGALGARLHTHTRAIVTQAGCLS